MATTLEDGSYVVLNASNTDIALDVYEQYDEAGTNVRLWERNGSNAQFWTVTTNSDGTRTIFAPLTGKILDVTGGVYKAGTNIELWDNTGLMPGKWTIKQSGTNYTADGSTMPGWLVSPAAASSLYLDAGGEGVAKAGDNVQLWGREDNPYSAQEWIFISCPTLPPGTYKVMSALDSSAVWDVSGASTANGANLILYGSTGKASQCFEAIDNNDGTLRLAAVHSGKVVSVSRQDRDPAKGDNVNLWEWYGADSQRWYTQWYGWAVKDGADAPTYVLRTAYGESELVIDACGASSAPKTNVWLWDTTGTTLGRCWRIQPTEALVDDLAVMSDIKIDTGDYSPAVVRSASAGTVTVYPSWVGGTTTCECRYRTRSRSTSSSSYGSWSAWKSISDGSASNDGWGTAWTYNCTTTASNGRRRSTKGVKLTLSATGYDAHEVQIEVRSCSSTYGSTSSYAHGNSVTRTCRLVLARSVSVGTVAWSPEGLLVPLEMSTPQRSGNTVTISAITLTDDTQVCGRVSETGQGGSCTIDVSGDALYRIPSDGAGLRVYWSWTTADGITTSGSQTVKCSWDAGHGLTLKPSVTELSGHRTLIKLGSHSTGKCWLITQAQGAVEIDVDSAGYCYVPYPFNSSYQVFCLARDSDTKWDTWHTAYGAREVHMHSLLWDAGEIAIQVDEGQPPTEAVTLSNSVNALTTTGREWQVANVGESKEGIATISGAWLGVDAKDAVALMRDCLAARYVWWRTPSGDVWRCAVESATVTRQEWGVASVSVTVRRVR